MRKKKSVYSSPLQKRMKAEKANRRQLITMLSGLGLLLGLVFLVGWGIYASLCHSVFFQVENIEVKGSERYSADEIVSLTGLSNKSNLVAVSRKDIEKTLRKTGWIRNVEINKIWPNALEIEVEERKPVAMLYRADEFFYMDSRGRSFARVEAGDDLDFPVLRVADEEILADKRVMKAPLDMLRYASHGNPDLPKQNISQLDIDGQGRLTMYLADNPFPVILGRDKMWTKYKRLTRVLAWLYKKRKFSTVASIDMEYLEGRVLVKFNG